MRYWSLAAVLVVAALLGSGFYTGAFSNGAQAPGSDNQPLQGTRSVLTTSAQSTSTASTEQSLSTQPLVLGPHPSTLIVQLTDPPVVPEGTTSLNLTYSAINLVVAVPASQSGQVTPQTVAVTPQGGSATLDLFKLQNVSQTLASAALPNGTTIYSLSFTVTGVSIEINGTVSPVTLATGASALQVTLAKSSPLNGTNALLVQLSPTVVDTPTGYQMIPSAVGILRVYSEVGGQSTKDVGSKQPITSKDKDELDQAKGKVTATLLALSVSGNSTLLTVRVNNTGGSPVKLEAIGLSGSFTAAGLVCTTSNTQTSASSTSKSTTTSASSNSATSTKSSTTSTSGEHHSTTTTTTSATNSTKEGDADQNSDTTTTFTTTMPPTTTLTSTVTSTTTSPTTATTTYTHSNTTYTYTYTITTKTTTSTPSTTPTTTEHHTSYTTTTTHTYSTTTYTRSTTSYTYSTSKSSGHDSYPPTTYCKGLGGLILIPIMAQPTTATTTSTSSSSTATPTTTSTTTTTTATSAKTCSAGKMVPVFGTSTKLGEENDGNVLAAGQCVDLTFAGPITFTFGPTSITIIPATADGQTYVLGVLGSSEAVMMSCKLPVSSTSCTEVVRE